MPVQIKAVVFRTPKLQATKEFFVTKLGLAIKEYSVTHFVIHSKGIRLLFVSADHDLEVELYVRKKLNGSEKNKLILQPVQIKSGLSICEDPNGIKIIVAEMLDVKNN